MKVDSFDVFGSRRDEEGMQLLHHAVTLASKAITSFHALAIGGSALFVVGIFIQSCIYSPWMSSDCIDRVYRF